MDRLAKLVSASLFALGYVSLSYAGYAQVSPPPGYSPGNGLASGAGGTYTYPSAANAAGYSGGTVRTNVALNVGGRAVSIPVSMRVAANAGRVAATAIYLHPALRTAAAVATWLGAAKFFYDVADGLWKRVDPAARISDGYEYGYITYQPTLPQACDAYLAYLISIGAIVSGSVSSCLYPGTSKFVGKMPNGATNDYNVNINRRPSACPAGWYSTPAGCVQTPPMVPVSQPDFEQSLPGARPMPAELPGVVWPAAWPIEIPEIQPTFIPTGNPVPNPNYDPSKAPGPNNQPYNQPGINVQPAPTPSSPWQVDVQPVNRPTANPNPGSDPIPNTNPDGTPKPDPGDKPRDAKDEDKQDLCEKHPDILSCQKIDEPEDQALDTKEKTISITPDSGWGADDASCPAPRYIYPQGRQIAIPFDLFCTYAHGLRPVVIAMAWLSAAFILVGARESS